MVHLRQRLQDPESIPECGYMHNVSVFPCNLPPSANTRQPVVVPKTRISIQAHQSHQSNSSEQVLSLRFPNCNLALFLTFGSSFEGISPLSCSQNRMQRQYNLNTALSLFKPPQRRSPAAGAVAVVLVSGACLERRRPPVKPVLLDLCATALNQQNQHDDKQDASDNSDNRSTVHKKFLSPPKCCICSFSPYRTWEPASGTRAFSSAPPEYIPRSELLDPCAAPLNEQNQHDYKEGPSHYSNNCRTVHLLFLLSSMASIEQFK